MSSLQWLKVTDVVCAVGVLLALTSLAIHVARSVRGASGPEASRSLASHATLLALVAAVGTMFTAIWRRAVEVNHFPSQTMPEVLMMFSLALLVSMLVLHFALGVYRRGPGWAILDDSMLAIVMGGAAMTHLYALTMSTAERDLPPALQSYWFPPHLSSLIFSYATLGIAGAICIVYFSARFWSGVWIGGRSRGSQVLLLAALTLVPFAQVVTLPVLLASGLVFLVLKLGGWLPSAAAIARMEKELDEVSFRAFSVGMPFLTAGLWMGAFWAQEAWANYWGWDSKENSALISWLVYVIYIHLRMLGGYRGEKAMAVLMGGALSIFITFQLFGYLPDSQKSLHRYTDDGVVPKEGMQGPAAAASASANETRTDQGAGG